MSFRRSPRFRSAFTLIELIVVVIVLGLLLAVALPSFFGASTAAQDSAAKQYLTNSYRAAKLAQAQADGALVSAASVVAALRSSEPELSFTAGNPGAANDPKTVIVQTDVSDARALTLGIASNSGKVCTLTVNAASSYAPVSSCDASGAFQGISLSGNELTDATRALGVQGDGLATPGGAGIWEGTTNLATNGGFESDTTGWFVVAPNTFARDTTRAKFGTASGRATRDTGTADTNSGYFINLPITSGSVYTASAWVWVPSSFTGTAVNFQVAVGGGSGAAGVNLALRDQWQRVAVTFTASSSVATYVILRSTGNTSDYVNIDGFQFEQKAFATPYVETNGAAATRAAASVTAPSSLLNATQGWWAARIRVGFGSTYLSSPTIAGWGIAATNTENYTLFFDGTSSGRWLLRRRSASANLDAQWGAMTFAAGDVLTVIGKWGSGQIGISVNGGAFVTTAASAAAPTDSTFGIGNRYGVSPPDSNVLWFAAGAGTLSDANAASIYGLPNTNPSFAPSWLATGVWNP